MGSESPTEREDAGLRRALAGSGITLRATIMALLVFYVAAGLLNGRHLYEAASLRAYGKVRTVWIQVLRPWREAAVATRSDYVRETAEKIRESLE
ncbi:MAG: hypothetical protein ABR497_09360 [Kiritimatiellia bacterium]|nr:hypothetical protein [Lentisphaerota bacterium]